MQIYTDGEVVPPLKKWFLKKYYKIKSNSGKYFKNNSGNGLLLKNVLKSTEFATYGEMLSTDICIAVCFFAIFVGYTGPPKI